MCIGFGKSLQFINSALGQCFDRKVEKGSKLGILKFLCTIFAFLIVQSVLHKRSGMSSFDSAITSLTLL